MKRCVNALSIGFLALSAAGCCEPGSGDLVQETRQVDSFDRLSLDVPGTIRINQGPPGPLKITTDDNLIDEVVTRVKGDTLVIETEDDHDCIDPTELTVQVSSEEVRSLVIDGSGDVLLRGAFASDEVELAIDGSGSIAADDLRADRVSLAIDGSGDIDVAVDAAELRSRIDGSGEIRISGTAGEHAIGIDGSGDIDAIALATATTRIEIDGSGNCAVAADQVLEVQIDGSGAVSYCGDPRVDERIDGSGSVSEASRSRCE
jgi:Putative auto-transporter adhesin, head GIN domain